MSAPTGPASSSTTAPLPITRKEPAALPAERRTWLFAIAPAYLGVFLWTPFYDRLWVNDLVRFHLPWLIASACGAVLLCHLFFYSGLADWGFRTGLTVETLATSTFGTAGSRWLLGVAVGLANVVIWAVAIDFAVGSTLLGLVSSGLLDAADLGPWSFGPRGMPPPVYLATALFWIFIIVMANQLRLIGVVAALMRVYNPVALLALTSIAAWTSSSLRFYPISMHPAAMGATYISQVGSMGPSAVQLICGYFALAGLASADRGAAAKRRRDVVLGGATGIVLAGAWSAATALVVVVGAVGSLARPSRLIGVGVEQVQSLSFRWAILQAIGGWAGGAILILLALAALAPGCYASWTYARKLGSSSPRISETTWVWIGGWCALGLVATSWASRTDAIFCLLGDLFAPVIGAMLADRLGQRGEWAGPRGAYNSAGLLAWAAGSALALALDFALMRNPSWAWWMPPTSILGLLGAGLVYRLLASAGREPAADLASAATTIAGEPRTMAQ